MGRDTDNTGEAQSKVDSILRAIEQTSPTIERKIYSDFPYVVHQYQRRGTLKAVIRILNPEGKAVADKVITDNFQDSDTSHDGYSPAGLREDPLELPSEDDIRARFVKKLYSEATGTARDFVGNYWQKVLAGASSVRDPVPRWEKLLTLAIQVPAMKDEATREIRQNLSNIPTDFVERINNQFEDKK